MKRIATLFHRGKESRSRSTVLAAKRTRFAPSKSLPIRQKDAIRDLEIAPILPNGCDSEPGIRSDWTREAIPRRPKGDLLCRIGDIG